MRLFVAINLPETERRRLGAAIETLAPYGLPVRWVGPDALHITLKFLGDVPDARLPAVRAALRRAVATSWSFDIALEGLSAFPSLSRPNIFWVGASQPAELDQLHHAIDSALEPLGFAREARAFKAHITIGRLKKDSAVRDRALVDRIVTEFGYKAQLRVVSADLMRSHLGPRGARYEVIEKVKLN